MSQKRVVILGAGVSGLSAAHELLERGFHVTIVDGRSKPGGKARSYMTKPWRPGETVEKGNALLPGEHGFRFFPGFYRHLDATMRKIPLDPRDGGRGRHVIDNLVPIREELLAVTGKPSITVPASAPSGPKLVDAFRSLLQFPKDLVSVGLTREDLELFANKLWQFATSSPSRRNTEYEAVGWRQFIQSLDRSDEYYWYLANGLTRVLVAAKGRKASTKTIGNVGLELLLCMTERKGHTDRVLNGPTNEVWFDPWVAYLDHLAAERGVRFDFRSSRTVTEIRLKRGRVDSIQLAYGEGGEQLDAQKDFDDVICALPVEVFAKLLGGKGSDLRKAGGEQFERIRTLAYLPGQALEKPSGQPQQFLEQMTGMQIYLKDDYPISDGHQIFPDSPWGLTSISQRQFWDPGQVDKWLPDGIGVLSVDISTWDLPGLGDIPAAADTNTRGIFEGTLRQLRGALGGQALSPKNIMGWHLDANAEYPANALEPILVNHVGSEALRPTPTTAIPNFFLAGDYVKTKTDLACMEGANESARNAVNGLFDTRYNREERCETFDPRDSEPKVLKRFQEMDDYRFKRGLPWGGVSLGDWMVRAGWAADAIGDVVLADDKGDTSLGAIERANGSAADSAPTIPSEPIPFRRPPKDWNLVLSPGRTKSATAHARREAVARAVAHAQPVTNDVLPKAFAKPGRVDPMFLRWPLFRIQVSGAEYIIPFVVYDADAVIVHGHAHNFAFLEKWTEATGGKYHPVFCELDGRKVGYAELWMVRYNDTVGGPYDEIVINYVVSTRPGRRYKFRSPYSALVPMMDPENRLFTIRLLVDERATPPPNQGPVKFGNELFGTDKRRERLTFIHEGQRRRIKCEEQGVKTLWMDMNFAESAVQTATDYIELAREIGLGEALRNARKIWRGDELGGGLVTPDFRDLSATGMPASTVEILASYKFDPKLSVAAAKGLDYLKKKVPPDSFAAILNDMGFEPQIAALDDHLKSVLYLENWPTATQPTADEERLPLGDVATSSATPVVDPPSLVPPVIAPPAAVVGAGPPNGEGQPSAPGRAHLNNRKPPPPS